MDLELEAIFSGLNFVERLKNFLENVFCGDRLKNFCEDLFFGLVSLVLGLGLEHSCPWPRECLSSEKLSLALASDFFCVLGLGLEPCVLDSTSGNRYFLTLSSTTSIRALKAGEYKEVYITRKILTN